MKHLLCLILLLVSVNAKPNDKGNGLSDVVLYAQSKSLEELLTHGTELTAHTFPKLAQKRAMVVNGSLKFLSTEDFLTKSGGNHYPGSERLATKNAQRFVWVLTELLRFGDDELMGDLITQNPDFYAAFSFKELRREVNELARNQTERDQKLSQINSMEYNFWIMVRGYITSSLGQEAWIKFSSSVDTGKLGFQP